MRDFLERDQLGYWQMQIKRRNEEVMQARADLHRRKISQQGSDAVSDSDQKDALREAMRRLRVAEEKVALIKKLIPQFHHAIAEYHSHAQPLGDHLTGGFERSLADAARRASAPEASIATLAASARRRDSSRPPPPRARGPRSAEDAEARWGYRWARASITGPRSRGDGPAVAGIAADPGPEGRRIAPVAIRPVCAA